MTWWRLVPLMITVTTGVGCADGSGDGSRPGDRRAPETTVHLVRMISDTGGGRHRFVPGQLSARSGDVIRFVNESGVHTVHFLPDSNPGRMNLPPEGPMIEGRGQSHEVAVTMPEGRYYFQCDLHEAAGMRGHVLVQ